VSFLESSGDSLRSTFEAERERASDELDFERAAALHKKVEKLDEVLRGQPDLTRRIQDLDAVILQQAAGEQVIAAFRIHGGRLCEPFFLPFGDIASQPRSVEQIFRNYLDPAATDSSSQVAVESNAPMAKGELSEHLWLEARWFYSNPRVGEIFFRENKDWPYRRILRACSRLLAPPPVPEISK
jgi:excinuclease UvrABC nuclease subunit